MKTAFILLVLCLGVLGSYVYDWEKVGAADDNENISFFVALKQRNIDKLEELLMRVSDPDSPQYGRHASKADIESLIYPPREEHDSVVNFFTSGRSSIKVKSYGDSLKVTGSAKEIGEIFGTTFHWYRHLPSGHKSVRADYAGITIPSEIADDIYMVTNLVSFPIIMHKRKFEVATPGSLAKKSGGYFAPSTIRRLYNIPPQAKVSNPNSSQAAVEFLPEGEFSFSDLLQFTQQSDELFFNFTQIVGPWEEGEDNTESELDVQVLGTIGSGAQNWFWTIADGWIYEMAVQIYEATAKPYVFSISYGWPEVFTCGGSVVLSNCTGMDNQQYISRANAELLKLGTMGYTVITCSQDEGAPSEANMECDNSTHPVFGIYPGSSPWVTTVSGTAAMPSKEQFVQGNAYPPICYDYPCSNSTIEYTCMWNNTYFEWTTGGGFSEFTPTPSYQQTVVEKYVSGSDFKPPAKFYWPKNRGYPDVSAIGARVLTIMGGQISIAEGTSASTPIIAGIATLLNDARFNAGKAPLGFLNPLLYKMAAAQPTAFKDITVGSNECTMDGECCKYGYGAGVGWDAVSGLGTPNFGVMLQYVQSLP